MENLILLNELNKRYTAYRAKLSKQSIDAADCLMEFEKSPLK